MNPIYKTQTSLKNPINYPSRLSGTFTYLAAYLDYYRPPNIKLVNCIWDLEPNNKPNKHDPTQSPFKRLIRQRKQGHCITIFLPPKGENIMGANSHW